MNIKDIDVRRACETDDELPLISRVGRGIKGDGIKVDVVDDEVGEDLTYLVGKKVDGRTGQETEIWKSDNINGGRLRLYYHTNPLDKPKTFTLTFVYTRPTVNKEGKHVRTHWHWVSPAIPYTKITDPVIGCTIGTLFLKDHSQSADDKYKEMTVYPADATSRTEFNAPNPPGGASKISGTMKKASQVNGEEWQVSMDIVEFDEFIKVIGLTKAQLKGIIQHPTGNNIIEPSYRSSQYWSTFANVKSDNIKDYIDDMFEAEANARGSKDSALEERVRKLEQYVSALAQANAAAFQQLLNRMYGTKNGHAGTASVTQIPIPSGTTSLTTIPEVNITWNGLASDEMVATGNMNILSEQTRNDSKDNAHTAAPVYIRTHYDDKAGDYKVK